MAGNDSQVNGQVADTVPYVRIGAKGEEQTHDLQVAAGTGYVQTGSLLVVTAIDVVNVRVQ